MSIQSAATHVVLIATDFCLCLTWRQVNTKTNKIIAEYNIHSSLTFALVSSDKDLACRTLLLPIEFSTDTSPLVAPSGPGTERLPDPEAGCWLLLSSLEEKEKRFESSALRGLGSGAVPFEDDDTAAAAGSSSDRKLLRNISILALGINRSHL